MFKDDEYMKSCLANILDWKEYVIDFYSISYISPLKIRNI